MMMKPPWLKVACAKPAHSQHLLSARETVGSLRLGHMTLTGPYGFWHFTMHAPRKVNFRSCENDLFSLFFSDENL